jgi:hypothetical protein
VPPWIVQVESRFLRGGAKAFRDLYQVPSTRAIRVPSACHHVPSPAIACHRLPRRASHQAAGPTAPGVRPCTAERPATRPQHFLYQKTGHNLPIERLVNVLVEQRWVRRRPPTPHTTHEP